jgi:hypothetical protein
MAKLITLYMTYFLQFPVQRLSEILLDILNIDRAVLKLRVERRAGLPVNFSLFLTGPDKNWDMPTKFTGPNITFLEMCSVFV